ncbi:MULTISPECIES: restriction endonuclease subunit S [Bacteroidales]|jgi:type I restriction enzyme S subunit|nr:MULTISPECIES: restriction endonuclease subunit S [Bacteroidales]KAB6212594.1 restriction endonuclease subunit S [Bacteroides xylanisolvens]KAB6301995.1 restriction endonuclease subunit S [Bacteroides xylanisolvens]KAB6319334.1 restriction endonuclease subunit S [Bacteroides xylanisolvens]KAB6352812.1 restriction endonuclease subunit S [Bacteroides xylanisolvens]MRY64561.1 restriction endonuclease subunit S [Parabacteroides distasonis]
MNGKQLKNSILQWAIQGKLVPQDPNDEPASVLLERIRAEKARLVKEKKIKKDKNESIIYRGDDNSYYEKFLATGEVKCIDEEIPFEIPNGWQWERIGNIFETTSGSTPLSRNPDYYKNGNINWVRTTDLNNGILNKTEIQITSKAIIDYNLSILPQTSVCVAMYGGAGTIGKHCILHFDTTINQSVCAIQPNGFCNMDYIHTFIEYQRPFWMDFAAGSRKDPNINQLIIKHCLLPIPPQEEQLRIVTKLNQLYPYIYQYGNSQNRLNQINKEIWHSLKKSILQEAIQGKLVPQIAEEGTAQELLEPIRQEKLQLVKEGKLKKSALTDSIIFRGDDNKYYEQVGKKCLDITEQIPFETPKNWVWTRLSHIANIYAGNSISETKKKSKFTDVIGRYYIGTKDVDFNNRIIYDNGIAIPKQYEPDFRLAPNNSILMCIEGGSAGRKIAILNQDVCFGNKLCCFSPFVGIGKYMYYYLQSPSFFELFNLNKTGIIGGVSIAKVKEILIPLPPIKEQQRIVAQIEKLFEQLR